MARHTAKSHKIRKVEILVIQTGSDRTPNPIGIYETHVCRKIKSIPLVMALAKKMITKILR